ncbi:MAG: acetolactate synthase small subunit [Oscillospiraceae bacterium]
MKNKTTISILVDNHAGVLSKVVGLFSRRGYNIDSLAVGETDDSAISRITIEVSGDEHSAEQIEKQLNKLISVIKIKRLPPGEYISRMLTLFKVSFTQSRRAEIMNIAKLMNAKIVDVSQSTITLEFTDTAERTETLEGLLRPFGIKECVRTGAIAIEKGATVTRSKKAFK